MKKKLMMAVAVGFVAASVTGCALEPATDTVTTDIGTPAIEENVADDDEDPLPVAPAFAQYPPTTIVESGECSAGSDA